MGKTKGGKGNKGKSNHVFKVAGARSLKIKNKAKQFAGQLKKLNEVNKEKTKEVDNQLASLQSEVRKNPEKPATRARRSCSSKSKMGKTLLDIARKDVTREKIKSVTDNIDHMKI